jgi:hypothetical protein
VPYVGAYRYAAALLTCTNVTNDISQDYKRPCHKLKNKHWPCAIWR